MPRTLRAPAVLAILLLTIGCQTVEDPFPPQSSINLDITDTALAGQQAPLPAPQVVNWRIEEASVSDLTGFDGTYSFLRSGPCVYQLNVAAPVSFGAACRTSGLTLTPGTTRTATVTVTISRLELRAAARPDLTTGADPDGDGVPNGADNCPIVPNPGQENVNPSQEAVDVGDACSFDDTSGNPTIADQDLDGIADVVDNCFWYPNPLQPGEVNPPDANKDGVGDACERNAPVVLPNGSLTVTCDVTFQAKSSLVAAFRLDFGRPGVLSCDSAFAGCTIDPTQLKLGRIGTSETFDCTPVP
ncbi:MAG TPA: thrombospondin type 3 repeat-containing protein [Candidatus Polarisedimenticolaceae bacterium]|nr:thrombospondin type 3 repeat-containing protein [Candidatus Polarisedimenticolaceae bacterium]